VVCRAITECGGPISATTGVITFPKDLAQISWDQHLLLRLFSFACERDTSTRAFIQTPTFALFLPWRQSQDCVDLISHKSALIEKYSAHHVVAKQTINPRNY
jgi:hypothetical protein